MLSSVRPRAFLCWCRQIFDSIHTFSLWWQEIMFPDKVTNYKVISTFHTLQSRPIMLISAISRQGYGNQIKCMHNPNSMEGFQVKTNWQSHQRSYVLGKPHLKLCAVNWLLQHSALHSQWCWNYTNTSVKGKAEHTSDWCGNSLKVCCSYLFL